MLYYHQHTMGEDIVSHAGAPPITHIAVIGLGRFGQLWADLLARHATQGGYRVLAFNRTPKAQLTFSAPVEVTTSLSDAVAPAQLIFLCTSISSLPDVLPQIAPHLTRNSVVCDTCSVKEKPQQWMEKLLPDTCALLGTHPMFGPDSLDAIADLPIVYTPIRITPPTLRQCVSLFVRLGLRAIKMDAAQHDYIAAYSQGVTHLVGRIAEHLRLTPTEIATLGYKQILQIMEQTCKDDWQLFIDIQRYNRHTKSMLKRFSRALRVVCRKIRTR